MSTFFFVVFLLTFQLFRVISLVLNKGVEITTIFGLMFHISISFLPLAVPLSIFFAAIFTLNRMSEDSEIVAMRSFGYTKWQLFQPFLIVAIFISSALFFLNQNLIPYSKRVFKNEIIRLTSKGLLADVKAGKFYTEIPDVTLFANQVSDKGKTFEEVFIHLGKSKEHDQIITAQKGKLIKKQTSKWGASNIMMNLNDGIIFKRDKKGNNVEKILFSSYSFPVMRSDLSSYLVTKDSMKTTKELYRSIQESERKEEIDVRKLVKTKLEFWSRINTPMQCLIFIFLGFVLGIKKGRGRSKNTTLIGLVVLIGYYALFFSGVSMARKEVLAPFLAVFLPSVVAFGVAGWFYKKLDWVG